MKKLLLLAVLVFSLNQGLAQDVNNNPEWEEKGNSWSWGPGGKPKDPVVPEPDTYGVFMGIGITTFLLLRRKHN